jgi:acetyl-CoA acetyltransferase
MTAPTVYPSAAGLGLYRTSDNPGVWPYRGKVAVVGVGHAPTLRRWDGDPQTSIGAWYILAARKAIEDAGVNPAEVDGLVFNELTSGEAQGSYWPESEPFPADFLAAFENTSDPFDGLMHLRAEWLVKNMPELTGLKFVIPAYNCMSMSVAAAAEAVGRGMGNVVLAVKGWHNLPGRYNQGSGGPNSQGTVSGRGKYGQALAGPPVTGTAQHFERYLHKYGKTHDMMAPFIVNSRANGLKFPEGYWYQHRPTPLTTEDYLQSRWIAEPANLLDNDIPIHTAAAYLFTTPERARDMRQPPVYVLGHAGGGQVKGDVYSGFNARSTVGTLEEEQENAARTARRVYESAGVSASDIDFENMYDGFSLFHVFWVEGFGFYGIKEGECLDFFASEDISINGPTPISPSGGNVGSGRTRFWNWTDTIQQLQGRAGERQLKKDAHVGIAGGWMPVQSCSAVLSKDPA